MKALLFLLAAMVAIVGTRAEEECSTYGTFPEYTKFFHSACVNHDRCYDRCSGKDFCDAAFLSDMLAICKGGSSGFMCECTAYIFYAAVRSFLGDNAYKQSCEQRG